MTQMLPMCPKACLARVVTPQGVSAGRSGISSKERESFSGRREQQGRGRGRTPDGRKEVYPGRGTESLFVEGRSSCLRKERKTIGREGGRVGGRGTLERRVTGSGKQLTNLYHAVDT